MTQLQQIQVRYEALEDRALLRIATNDEQEFRFWITRRYAALMLTALTRNLEADPALAGRTASGERADVLAFQRDAALGASDFQSDYRERQRTTPLGDHPLLLARLSIRRLPGGDSVLKLHPQSGQGIEVRLNDRLIHSLVKLLEDAARRGNWGLPAAIPEHSGPAPSQPLN